MYLIEVVWKDPNQKTKYETYETLGKALQIKDVYLEHSSVAMATVFSCRQVAEPGAPAGKEAGA